GEELIIDNTDKAVDIAARSSGALVNDYTAAPLYFSENNNGAHEWLIEFEREPADIMQFTYDLDKALKNINSDYEAKRHKDIALRMPVIKSLPKNTLANEVVLSVLFITGSVSMPFAKVFLVGLGI